MVCSKRNCAASFLKIQLSIVDSFITAFYSDRSVKINLETIKQYDEKYHAFHRAHGTFIQEWTKQGEIELILQVEETVLPERVEKKLTYDLTIDPRPAQLEALEGLEATVAEKC